MGSYQPAFLKRPPSNASLKTQDDSRYDGSTKSLVDKFSLSADPSNWNIDRPEPDDDLHRPDPRRDVLNDSGTMFTIRGLANLGCLALLLLCTVTLFAGYPVISHYTRTKLSFNDGFNYGGSNASGVVPELPGHRGPIDPDTPDWALTRTSLHDGSELKLVFSDEFDNDGRTFYPGDDPYWEATDLHYWQTGNLEWYDPATITTKDGALKITLSKKNTHDLKYQGGMMSSWNRFCFTGGYIEVAVTLPGLSGVAGLWPAIWTMGNLGRAGYGASLEGMWPYTYDTCDVGTVPNQTWKGVPDVSSYPGDKYNLGDFSYLPGQRLSRCTCPGEDHPGPMHDDKTFVGRSAPEIDIFEATSSDKKGAVSQSGQWGPFNAGYEWFNTTENLIIPDPTITQLNSYTGGVFQQAISAVSIANGDCYELNSGCYAVYGFEYKPGFVQDNAYISWINNNKTAWTMNVAGTTADSRVNIGPRPVPQEPMYMILNLGISPNFGDIDFEHLTFPTVMSVDYVRVYQRPDNINVGCDPDSFPTQKYINEHIDAYTNPNLTTWRNDYQQPFPKNKFKGEC
ncbi:glycoside hydrolase family 16 protein [Thelephora ganbajun]|uniref:Glycoside hydrolase family 16 protein n=1 Tax=Thelephora ganbajun TaxID=370292 RepID=A0ACB6ZC77_THEGA|nr:glycoside hydrolase family 16 protein [Thelephora ganbajun]